MSCFVAVWLDVFVKAKLTFQTIDSIVWNSFLYKRYPILCGWGKTISWQIQKRFLEMPSSLYFEQTHKLGDGQVKGCHFTK